MNNLIVPISPTHNIIQPLGSYSNPVVIEDVEATSESTISYIIISDDEVDGQGDSDMDIESESEAIQLPRVLGDQSNNVPSGRDLQGVDCFAPESLPVENNFVGEASSKKGKSVRFQLPVQANDVFFDGNTQTKSFPEVCANLRGTTKAHLFGYSESIKEIENIFGKRLKFAHDSQVQPIPNTPDEPLKPIGLTRRQKKRLRTKNVEKPRSILSRKMMDRLNELTQKHAEKPCFQAEPMDNYEHEREKINAPVPKFGNRLRLAVCENIHQIQPPPIIDENIYQLIQSDCDEMRAIRASYFNLALAHIAYQHYQTASEGCLTRMTSAFTEDTLNNITNHFQMNVGFVDYLYGLMRCEGEEKALKYFEQVIGDAMKLVWTLMQTKLREI
ncbi:3120_t:CDS:2 [Paraglomus occultum]|uniref:3120_t:CDS:1 n=1 Tax=Paraglomus occultum TaxID=144539 RepID=A0A9N9F590_9GLOM|nr:3120_t:CDS:2 [Paraglomus occultum]